MCLAVIQLMKDKMLVMKAIGVSQECERWEWVIARVCAIPTLKSVPKFCCLVNTKYALTYY